MTDKVIDEKPMSEFINAVVDDIDTLEGLGYARAEIVQELLRCSIMLLSHDEMPLGTMSH